MSPIGGHDVVEKEKGKKMFDVKTGKKVYIKEKMSKKMEHISSTRLEAMERAYKNQGRSVPLRYKVKK